MTSQFRPLFTLITGTLLLAGLGFVPDANATGALNDTGVTFCGGTGSIVHDCTTTHVSSADASHGRDALARTGLLDKTGGSASNNGFDYSRISTDGRALRADAAHAGGHWGCTRDNVTGLTWELKRNVSRHLRGSEHRYTWYDPSSPDGNPGSEGTPDTCALRSEKCNTFNYVATINRAELCGYADWRLPTIEELFTLYNFAHTFTLAPHNKVPSPPLDADYFPVQANHTHWWSATPFAGSDDQAWVMALGSRLLLQASRSEAKNVRLVRGQWRLHGEPR